MSLALILTAIFKTQNSRNKRNYKCKKHNLFHPYVFVVNDLAQIFAEVSFLQLELIGLVHAEIIAIWYSILTSNAYKFINNLPECLSLYM